MKKEKHEWVTKTDFVCVDGDEKFHKVNTYEQCKKCKVRK